MEVEIITDGVFNANEIVEPKRKRRVRRTGRTVCGMRHMPSEVLEQIFLDLDPKTVCAATAVNRRFAYIGSSRFWMKLLKAYWVSQSGIEEPISARLALSKTLPTPQIHFLSFRNYALGVQAVAGYAESLCVSGEVPFEGSTYLGLALPHAPVRNGLARFFPDRQFYIAAFGAEETNFHFSAIVLSAPKVAFTGRAQKVVHRAHSKGKRSSAPARHFFPIGLKSAEQQASFLLNFKGATINSTPDAMLLVQAISSLFVAAHTKGSLARISVKIPGLSSLPPPEDVKRFFVRTTIAIARIPSLAMEFKFEDGVLCDLGMHTPSQPWRFVD